MTHRAIITAGLRTLNPQARSEYDELAELLRQDEFDAEVLTERVDLDGRRGLIGGPWAVTWVEVVEIWILSTVGNTAAAWTVEKVLDTVSDRAKQWVRGKRRRELERKPDRKVRPQSIIVRNAGGVEERRIDIDSDGNITEYRWVEVKKGEHTDSDSDH